MLMQLQAFCVAYADIKSATYIGPQWPCWAPAIMESLSWCVASLLQAYQYGTAQHHAGDIQSFIIKPCCQQGLKPHFYNSTPHRRLLA